MSERDEDPRVSGPAFHPAEGASRFPEEPHLPPVDLYSEPEGISGGASPITGEDPSRATNPYAQQQPQQPGESYPPLPYQQGQPYAQGQQGVQPWGYAPYGVSEHPQATLVLVLALVGFAVPVTPFIAWYLGTKAKREIERGAPYRYEGTLKVGHIIGLVLSLIIIVVTILYVLFFVAMMGFVLSG